MIDHHGMLGIIGHAGGSPQMPDPELNLILWGLHFCKSAMQVWLSSLWQRPYNTGKTIEQAACAEVDRGMSHSCFFLRESFLLISHFDKSACSSLT